MLPKIFIDGREGTTGLQIFARLSDRADIELLQIDELKRKDIYTRKKLINEADLVFLCLPDEAARESVSLIENSATRVIDASTVHRTHPDWVYGLPELSPWQSVKIKAAQKVANPGCHATGFIVIVYPLIALGILPLDYPLTCFSLTGYSGGGKLMISYYEKHKTEDMFTPGMYALGLMHKHLPEMMAVTGLKRVPAFCPIVDDFYRGMATSITLHNDMLMKPETAESIRGKLAEYYADQSCVYVARELGNGTLYCNWGAGTDDLEITVSGNDAQTLITARFDNLGKGASGAAVQNMELMLGL